MHRAENAYLVWGRVGSRAEKNFHRLGRKILRPENQEPSRFSCHKILIIFEKLQRTQFGKITTNHSQVKTVRPKVKK